ncbi:hypothetical protein [Bacillus cereus]|uniref:hypothetical protein n=1 Tax=Bacillus cereus TaxID=1396 RepID=UPI001481ED59|nr:hypothetical protein [Bacillus cereus]
MNTNIVHLCIKPILQINGGSDVEVSDGIGNGGCIYCEPEGVTPFVGPVTFTIPLRQPFSPTAPS